MLLGIVFAGDVIRVIGSPEYASAASVLRILMLALAISYLNGVYGHALVALGQQNRLFVCSALVLAANVALNLALIPPLGIDGAAIAVVLSELLAFVVVRALYGRVGTPPGARLEPRMLLAAAVMVVAVAPRFLLPDDLAAPLVVIAGGVVGVGAYAVALIVLKAVPEAIATHLPGRAAQLGRRS
jgi:O-antigen/teichoic acid export membrane protein